MQFVQAQFSLKYEPLKLIRRYANELEDLLNNYYNPPQTIPIPDDFSPEAPRVIFYSKFGHSQISFSQIAVDFTVNFDNDFIHDFDKTKTYIEERIEIISKILEKIGINNYYFCGISYNCQLNTGDLTPIEYMKKIIGKPLDGNIYDASQRSALLVENNYFVNQQIGTYKEFKSNSGIIPNLLDLKNCYIASEGVALNLDVNNRYGYMYNGIILSTSEIKNTISKIFVLIQDYLNRWK